MYEHIRYEVEEPCAIVTLSRPDKLNAWTSQMERELRHALAAAERDARVVGIILTGAGRAFCAGADMSMLQTLAGGEALQGQTQPLADPGDPSFDPGYRQTYSYLASLAKPVVAAINGPCVGMAVPIACFCDLRFASSDAMFMTAFARRGLVAEWGSAWMLPRLCGVANAFDLLLSSRKVGADEALRMGLVNRVFAPADLLEQTKAYVRQLAKDCSPASLRAMKKQLYHDLLRPLDESLREATRLMFGTFSSEDFKEGVASFVEKRPPAFKRIG